MARRGYAGGKLAAQAIAQRGVHLKTPPDASAEFTRLWKTTVEDFDPEYFKESDRVSLETYIDLALTLRMLQAQLKSESLLVDSPHGMKENPLLGSIVKVSGKVAQYARVLRLTPASRLQQNTQPTVSMLKESGAEDSDDSGIRLVK